MITVEAAGFTVFKDFLGETPSALSLQAALDAGGEVLEVDRAQEIVIGDYPADGEAAIGEYLPQAVARDCHGRGALVGDGED